MPTNRRNAQTDDEMLDDSDAAVERAMSTSTDNQLRLFIERIERMEEEKKGQADDIRDTYNEAKSQGYDPKMMRRIVALRKMNPEDRREMEAIMDVYKAALGMD